MYRIGQEEIDAVARVINNGMLFRINTDLQECDQFERELAQKIGTKYALYLSSGTGALIAALAGIGIGPGDEVIVPGYTFMASAMAVVAVGAIPVIAEIDDTMTLDINDVKRKISKHTKAIIPVHICGFPCNMEALCKLADEYDLFIIEDACQADGGSYKGKRLGTFGKAGCFSFNYFKVISVGEGGAVVTDDEKVYERALIYHDSGAAFRPYSKGLTEPVFLGAQLRVSEITGAIMREQLKRLDGILNDLRAVKKEIIAGISGSGLTVMPSNDPEGDCGTTLGLQFKSEKAARAFNACEGFEGMLPIDSGKHVYTNWTPILEKRGAHNEDVNPYNHPKNQGLNMNVSKDTCPYTLDILSRTVFISLHPDWDKEKINATIKAICDAAKTVGE